MPREREFLERLTAADESLANEQLSPSAVRRIGTRMTKELKRNRWPSVGWVPMLTFVAGAALVLLFLRWSTTPDEQVPQPVASAAPTASTVLVTGPDCSSHSDTNTEIWGACDVTSQNPAMEIDTIEAAHLTIDGPSVRVHEGTALFDVEKVRGEPVRVLTPTGEIVVVGTRFRVVVSGETSQVDLYEGRLEFHDKNGTVTPINAGQHLEFGPATTLVPASPAADQAPPSEDPPPPDDSSVPTSEVPTPQPKVATTRPAKPKAKPRDAGALIESVERLRRRGKYAEAAKKLETALAGKWPTRTGDVLSYELGRILARHLPDQRKSCAHWTKHLQRFASTRYRSQIERSKAMLECE